MQIVERGTGDPLIVVPGLQGRWEYIEAAVEALSAHFRVITFSLCDERSSGCRFDASRGFDNYVDQVRDALDQRRVDRAVVCGISFGGLIALRFAASHPDRAASLVLASTPGPGWHLRPRHAVYSHYPYLFGPLFFLETPWRLRRELAACYPARAARWRFTASQLGTLARAPLSVALMGRRAQLIGVIDIAAECRRIVVPTLIVTGERDLDHVVPVGQSVGYVSLIPGARGVVLERTGHLGTITRADRFASIVREFADRQAREVA
jgi:pimeloyl-ACP methyl ester carboxylesterase